MAEGEELLTPLQFAMRYYELGFSVVPLEARKKTPISGFDLNSYFVNRASKQALVAWFDSGINNIAIILGAVSQAFAVDIDGDEANRFLAEKVPAMSVNLQSAIANTMASRTGKGLHLIFRFKPEEFPEGLKTQKLWTDRTQKHSEIMIKAEGGYIVAPPSIHPETGKQYELVAGKDEPFLLMRAEIEELVRIISPKSQQVENALRSGFGNRASIAEPEYNNALTPEKMVNIIAIIEPFYTEGHRNGIIFALSGYLRKSGAPRDNTKRLISALSEKTHDKEKASRLVVVERTYQKPISEVTGYNALLDEIRLQLDDQRAYNVMAELTDIVEKNRPMVSTPESKKLSEQDDPDLVEEATEAILQDFKFLTIEETRDVLYYKEGVYVSGGDTLIEKHAEALYGYRLTTRDVNEITDHIIRRTMKSKAYIDANLEIINLRNGLYNWVKNTLEPHTPEHLSIDQKPIVYDPKATPQRFMKFLTEVLYKTEIRTLVELMAYTFYKDNPYELITILSGTGSNGKSVLTGVLEALHGQQNVSHVTLQQMLDDTYALSDLYGKSVNIDPELSDMTISDTAVLKRLTGRMPIRTHRKNQRAFDFINHAKLFFNANKIPRTDDDSDAWYRRNIIISFPNQFEEGKADPNLQKKLTAPEELSGVFNMLMANLRMIILRRGKIYLNERTIAERRAKYEMAMNPLKFFGKTATEKSDEEYTIKETLYQAYKRFCSLNKLPVESENTFGKKVKDILKLEEGRENRGERRRYWKGIVLKQFTVNDDEQEMLGI